jgi:hypothetical protein
MDQLEEIKASRNALRREQYAIDGGKRREYNQAWKDAHRDQVKEVNREWSRRHRLNPDVKERERTAAKKWRDNNLERARESSRRWFREHPDYMKQWAYEDRRKNPVRYMLRNSRNRAKEIGVEFALLPEHIVIPEFCPVLGMRLEQFDPKAWASPSIDRLDNSKGYTPDNIKIISNRANMIKRDGTLEEHEAIVRYMRGETG